MIKSLFRLEFKRNFEKSNKIGPFDSTLSKKYNFVRGRLFVLTIFAIPKAFQGHNAIIQTNAIKSWKKLSPSCEIILFGNDYGIGDAACKLGVFHVPKIETNDFGTPFLSSVFSIAQKIARNNMLMYVNSDIIFFQDLIEAIKKIDRKRFLLCGRRWDYDLRELIDFEDDAWDQKLKNQLFKEGEPHGLSGIDFFVFPRDLIEMPPFLVGRIGWDTWLIYSMRMQSIPVIDGTSSITALHQNHDFSHSKFGKQKRVSGPELSYNIDLAGGYSNMLTLRDANWLLTPKGLRKAKLLRRLYCMLSTKTFWRKILAVKRITCEQIKKWLTQD